ERTTTVRAVSAPRYPTTYQKHLSKTRSPPLLFISILGRLPPRLFRLEHRPAGHAEIGKLAAGEGLHHFQSADHAHAPDGAHHVSRRLELLHELADFGHVHSRAAGDSPPPRAVEAVGVPALLLVHRVVDGAHPAHLLLDFALAHVGVLGDLAHARDHAHDLAHRAELYDLPH